MKFLIIQTAFIGDVVLATPIVEKLRMFYPDATIDFLLRKGNESLLTNHPHIHNTIIFDKRSTKYSNLFKLIKKIRAEKYDYVINAQRFFTTGLIAALSGGKHTIGFEKNPLSFLFNTRVPHIIDDHGKMVKAKSNRRVQQENSAPPLGGRGAAGEDHGETMEDSTPSLGGRGAAGGDKGAYVNILHETHRNLLLIEAITDKSIVNPRLYPSKEDYQKVTKDHPYICIAPASVWFTKQFPKERWIEFITSVPQSLTIYLLGAKTDISLIEEIRTKSLIQNPNSKIQNLAGQLSFLESAALMQKAVMNYVNDSAPLHFASAMNAPVTAIFCSTIPEFGFGPLSDQSFIGQINYDLYCRPCGLHGYKACPEGHFRCSEVDIASLIPIMKD